MKFSKLIVAAVIGMNVLFTVAVFCLCWNDKTIPDSLIISWFGFTTGELWAVAFIKKHRLKKEAQEGEKDA